MAEENEVFAFGESIVQGFACPALAVEGEIPSGEMLTIAEKYDSIARERYGIDEGLLPKSVAESCWNEAVDSLRADAENYLGRDDEHANYLKGSASSGESLAAKAFC